MRGLLSNGSLPEADAVFSKEHLLDESFPG